MTDTLVDFHLPLAWYLDLRPETGDMTNIADLTEEQAVVAEATAALLGGAVRDFGAEVLFPADRWAAWGTEAVRGQLRRMTLRVPEVHLQTLARSARIVADETLRDANVPVERAVVITASGDERQVLMS